MVLHGGLCWTYLCLLASARCAVVYGFVVWYGWVNIIVLVQVPRQSRTVVKVVSVDHVALGLNSGLYDHCEAAC